MVTYNTGDDNFGVTSYIVDPTAGQGNYQTIGAALTAASAASFSGTIFIRPGTYTENLTLVAGVNLSSWTGEGYNTSVIILGNCTLSTAGSVTISGIQLKTNSANCLTVSGSVASILNLIQCNINCINNTGISFSSSNSSSAINLYNCTGSLGNSSVTYFISTASGPISIFGGNYLNTNSVVASSSSAAPIYMYGSVFGPPLSVSSTGTVELFNSVINFTTAPINNSAAVVIAGSGTSTISGGYISGGTSPSITVATGSTLNISNASVQTTSGSNSITGLGVINYTNLAMVGSAPGIGVSTQTGGIAKGLIAGTAPAAGFIGEQIRSNLALGSATSLTTGTAKTVTSISLTAGIWDVSGCLSFIPNVSTASTQQVVSISTTNNTLSSAFGDDALIFNIASTAGFGSSMTIPSLRVTLSATTTYYLVAQATFTVSTLTAYGRISATRVG